MAVCVVVRSLAHNSAFSNNKSKKLIVIRRCVRVLVCARKQCYSFCSFILLTRKNKSFLGNCWLIIHVSLGKPSRQGHHRTQMQARTRTQVYAHERTHELTRFLTGWLVGSFARTESREKGETRAITNSLFAQTQTFSATNL